MGVVGGEGKEIAGFTFLYKILNFFSKAIWLSAVNQDNRVAL